MSVWINWDTPANIKGLPLFMKYHEITQSKCLVAAAWPCRIFGRVTVASFTPSCVRRTLRLLSVNSDGKVCLLSKRRRNASGRSFTAWQKSFLTSLASSYLTYGFILLSFYHFGILRMCFSCAERLRRNNRPFDVQSLLPNAPKLTWAKQQTRLSFVAYFKWQRSKITHA